LDVGPTDEVIFSGKALAGSVSGERDFSWHIHIMEKAEGMNVVSSQQKSCAMV
jgi:hypothetical protein